MVRISLLEHPGERAVARGGQVRVRLHHRPGLLSRVLEKRIVSIEVGEAKSRKSVLFRAEQVPLAPESQILTRDFESVIRASERPEALGWTVSRIEGHAIALLTASTYPAPELV